MGNDISVVANGYLAENDLNELVEVYMGELVGDHVYEQYGNLFPLLIKTIDTQDNLSIQVHPDDEVAWERHRSLGKDEMWYVMDCKPAAQIILGLNQSIDKETLLEHLNNKDFNLLVNKVEIHKGDAAFLPAGLVHALRENVCVAEIQETSDITYRLHDYDRLGQDGQPRQLHIEEALDVINYEQHKTPLIDYSPKENGAVNLVESSHFVTNLISFNCPIGRDYVPLDSFVIYICVEGSFLLLADNYTENGQPLHIQQGEAVLLPASTENVLLTPQTKDCKLLEVYTPSDPQGE